LHLYAIASDVPGLSEPRLSRELELLGGEFALDPATLWSASSRSGRVIAAGLHASPGRCGPRRYVDRSASTVTWFDGLPVAAEGDLQGHDARSLAARWGSLHTSLEGQFSAAQVQLEDDRAELLLDTLGLAQVMLARHEGGLLVSNSAGLLASLLDRSAPDPLGVSSMLGLGWTAADRTLNLGVEVLCGGARHRIEGGTVRSTRHFGPHTIPERRGARIGVHAAAGALKTLTVNAVGDMDRVGCALTAGRDTRILTALMQATGQQALYFTGGSPSDADVVVAEEIASRLGLRHETVPPDWGKDGAYWTEAAVHFMRQNDGLVSLLQIRDYIDLSPSLPPLGVKLWGVGGEIGRCGLGVLTSTATNVPLLRSSARVQRRLLAAKARDEAGIMTADAQQVLAGYLEGFRLERLTEGWRQRELMEAFYIFERVARWGATGPRRMAGTDDIFGPLCSRAFIDYCFSVTSGERLVEAPHHRLLTELSPALRDHRYDTPFPRPRPRLAPAIATLQLVRALAKRGLPARAGPQAAADAQAVQPEFPMQHAWFEARLEMMRELFSIRDSELWSFVSRPRIEALLNGSEADRARYQEGLLRAATVFWHFHGMPTGSPPAAAIASGPQVREAGAG
jgi:asparagine synthase (glutamine-hydrolysing)